MKYVNSVTHRYTNAHSIQIVVFAPLLKEQNHEHMKRISRFWTSNLKFHGFKIFVVTNLMSKYEFCLVEPYHSYKTHK